VLGLLKFTRWIDALNDRLAILAAYLVLLACLVSGINAAIRYAFAIGSNAWLELQWYMFAGIVMFGTAKVLRVNEHVRVDIVYGGRSPRTKATIDLIGLALFLLPMTLLMVYLSWPFVVDSYVSNEMSSNAGGLIRWPFKVILPLGFALLALQGAAEIIKRVAYLRGELQMDTHYERPLQ
jgi:TRAP-type mannitol/chloroaromatic compound transport system permease small subunit